MYFDGALHLFPFFSRGDGQVFFFVGWGFSLAITPPPGSPPVLPTFPYFSVVFDFLMRVNV